MNQEKKMEKIRYYSSVIISQLNPKGIPVYLTLHFINKQTNPWRFPGGKVEPNELPIAAAARELDEEIGLQASGLELIEVTEPHQVDNDKWVGYYFLLTSSYNMAFAILEPTKNDRTEFLTAEQIKEYGNLKEYEILRKLEGQVVKEDLWEQ